MARQTFLTFGELKKLTGEVSPRAQIAVLRQHGLNPFVNQTTGQAVIYREAVMQSMCRIDPLKGDSAHINWDAINEKQPRVQTT